MQKQICFCADAVEYASMPYDILDDHNHDRLADALREQRWVVACLCADWCGSCREYAASFAAWAEKYPQHYFVWIDIEDQAALVGDLDVDNFPTLLMQHGACVSFFGPMEPDTRLADRLLQALADRSDEDRQREADSTEQRRRWQTECDLQQRLASLSGETGEA